MATPDLSTLTSSAQIFSSNRTLPQIRAVHKALHAEIDDKAARLRTQVGASYRDLLGTADAIVAMRADVHAVQASLGRMGARCGRSAVDAKVSGLGRFVGRGAAAATAVVPEGRAGSEAEAESAAGLGAVARARLLEACAVAVERILRGGVITGRRAQEEEEPAGRESFLSGRGDRLVVAARLVLLGRLLVKSFGRDFGDEEIRAVVGAASKRLGSLTLRLSRKTDRLLQAAGERTTRGDVLKALTAYSLATGSGARVTLRHFLSVREKAMAVHCRRSEDEKARGLVKDVLKCLGLYTRTILDVQALTPSKLTESLGALKNHPLLEDDSLEAIEGLRLDIFRGWCGDEIRYFTPFIRHDDLDGKQAREMLMDDWAEAGSNLFLQGLEQTLSGMSEFTSMVELRTSVLKLWISEGGRIKGFDPSAILDQVREVIKKHMLRVLDGKVGKLRLVGSEVSATLDAWQEGVADAHLGLWDEGSFDIDLANGATHFTEEVISRLYGRNDAVSKALSSYRSWYRVIDDVEQVVEQLKRQRWDNDAEEEIEDEETIEERQQLLSKDDPKTLADHLNSSLVRAFGELDEQLTGLWATYGERPNKGQIAMYLVRVVRDIRSQLPDLREVKQFGLGIVPGLQEAVSSSVAISPLDELSATALTRKVVAGRALWEGEPQLPTSPSPETFKFLRNTSLSMSDAGMDLWSPAAVRVLKRLLGKRLCELWRSAMDSQSAQRAEKTKDEAPDKADAEAEAEAEALGVAGKGETSPNAEQQRDLLIQWSFDIAYLQSCLAPVAKDELEDLGKAVFGQTGLESLEARQQIVKVAREYWKKTSLLFGLLS